MMREILIALGAERYLPMADSLTGDPVIMLLMIANNLVMIAACLLMGAVLLFGSHSPIALRPQVQKLFGAIAILAALTCMVQIATLFVGVYRLDVVCRSAMAFVTVTTALIIFADVIQNRRG